MAKTEIVEIDGTAPFQDVLCRVGPPPGSEGSTEEYYLEFSLLARYCGQPVHVGEVWDIVGTLRPPQDPEKAVT